VLVLAYFVLFFRLGSAPIQLWDEARLAVNAAEMLARHDWLVTYYNGQPDHWNTKPPLMLWLQVLSIAGLGYSQVAVRLPAALAALATVLLTGWFGYRQLGHWLTGWLAALVLLTTSGFVSYHVARTGDYDALLVGWLTLGTFAFFRYLATQRAALCWLAAGAFTLAVLTKGVAGVLDWPALVLYIVLTGRLRWLLARREFYAGLVLFAGIVGGYYYARELADPGYLAAVLTNELSGRALQALEGNGQSWDYYINNLVVKNFTPWLSLAVLGGLLSWRLPAASAERQFSLLASLLVVWHVLVISLVKTKLAWYDAPIYPLLALLAGLGVQQVAEAMHRYYAPARPNWNWVLLGAGLLLVGPPYQALRQQLDAQHDQRFADAHLQFGRYLAFQAQQRPDFTEYTVLETAGYNASLEWYRQAQQATKWQKILCRYNADTVGLRANQLVVVCSTALRRQLQQQHAARVVLQQDSCATLLLAH
jgi:4-amino-4-deoxy-L-arabinose transferase-like glycosyltransferase